MDSRFRVGPRETNPRKVVVRIVVAAETVVGDLEELFTVSPLVSFAKKHAAGPTWSSSDVDCSRFVIMSILLLTRSITGCSSPFSHALKTSDRCVHQGYGTSSKYGT